MGRPIPRPLEPTVPIALRQYSHADLPEIRQTLLDVHADSYADQMDDPFVQRFPWFVDHWGGNAGFACVIGWDGSEPVGFAYGAPATAGSEWWRDHIRAPENPSTFSLSELMVRPKWRKTGASERLHEGLLTSRDEALAVLLVDTTHPRVQALYESWQYRKIGERQPFPDSPVYAVMIAVSGCRGTASPRPRPGPRSRTPAGDTFTATSDDASRSGFVRFIGEGE